MLEISSDSPLALVSIFGPIYFAVVVLLLPPSFSMISPIPLLEILPVISFIKISITPWNCIFPGSDLFSMHLSTLKTAVCSYSVTVHTCIPALRRQRQEDPEIENKSWDTALVY